MHPANLHNMPSRFKNKKCGYDFKGMLVATNNSIKRILYYIHEKASSDRSCNTFMINNLHSSQLKTEKIATQAEACIRLTMKEKSPSLSGRVAR